MNWSMKMKITKKTEASLNSQANSFDLFFLRLRKKKTETNNFCALFVENS